MADFPDRSEAARNVLSTMNLNSPVGQAICNAGSVFSAAATWPTASKAVYIPVLVQVQVTVYQMSIEVAVQAGNVDVGIYDEGGNKIVSSGSTATAAAGVQLFNITDTILSPGSYYLAFVCDSTTASFSNSTGLAAMNLRVCGVREQATALPLPATATFAVMSLQNVPRLQAHCFST